MTKNDDLELAESIARGEQSAARVIELAAHPELHALADSGSALTEGRGIIDACVAVCVLPREQLIAMLPAGLQLAPQPLAPPGRHPLVVMFAHNDFSAWFGEMRYHEITLAIPWVEYAEERTPHRGPFVYLPRLWLDQTLPRVLGNRIYGYEKLPARVDVDGGDWQVRDEGGDLLVRARFDDDGEPRAPADWPAFEWARRVLEQPTISQVRRVFDADARAHDDPRQVFYGSTVRYVLSGRDAEGAPVEASIAPLLGELAFGGGLSVPGLLPQEPITLPSLASDVLGAFRMRCAVRVSLPGSTTPIRYPMGAGRKLRVAVLGGGPSACAAAYWLARQPERFEVDVYTMGWRLGGKCAAQRNPDAHDRIEEHGLHAFPGFYHNAFRTLRSVYEDLGWSIDGEDGPFTGAFLPRDHVGVMDRVEQSWRYFPTPIRRNERRPGALPTVAELTTGDIGEALRGLVRRVVDILRRDQGERDVSRSHELRVPLQRAVGRVAGWIDRRGAIDIEDLVETPLAASRTKRWILHLLAFARAKLPRYFREDALEDPGAWFEWGTLDTLLTIAIGVLTESTLDFDELDDRDFRGWLVEHGLAPRHHDISAIMQVYETLFAHAPDLPYRYGELACGVGLRWFLLMAFGYSGHIAYDFRHACPETLMSPYLLALEQHGARVHFFHRVDALELRGEGDARQLARVRMAVQAEPTGDGYRPFIGGAEPDRTPPAWPSAPHYDQLANGEQLAARLAVSGVHALESGVDEAVRERVLEHGRDFDVCVLAIPIGALPPLVGELTRPSSPQHDPRWLAMLEGISLIETVSAQLWLDRPAADLFEGPPRGLLTGFEHPQASLGEFSHLIPTERWEGAPPQLALYLTGALLAGVRLPQGGAELLRHAEVRSAWWRERFELWLAEHYRELFPRGPSSYEGLLELLRVPARSTPVEGPDRLAAQWFDVARYPSDLYVMSRPGELRLRMAPHESGVRFMLLAGDWTRTDLNCGCVEAATQSGMLAARVLSGEPVYLWRTGF